MLAIENVVHTALEFFSENRQLSCTRTINAGVRPMGRIPYVSYTGAWRYLGEGRFGITPFLHLKYISKTSRYLLLFQENYP